MYLVRYLYHLDPLHELYAAFDEPLLRYACRRFLPLAYGKHVVLHEASSFQQIIHRELATIVLDRLILLSMAHHGGSYRLLLLSYVLYKEQYTYVYLFFL